MDKEEALSQIGLSEREIAVFLASLELGQSTVNSIARKAGVFRTYCYDLLNSLEEKGLVSTLTRADVKYFEAVDPNRLIDILKEKERYIQRILPELNAMKESATVKPRVRFFEGTEGVKYVNKDFLQTKPQELLVFGNTTMQFKLVGHYLEDLIKSRIENKIPSRVITEKSQITISWIKKKEKAELRQTKFFPKQYTPTTLKYIYGNKVAIHSFQKDVVGMIIENEEIAKGERLIFNMIWKLLK